MHPIVVQEMAQHRIADFERGARADRLAALAKGATSRRFPLRDRVTRTAVRLHLVFRGSTA